jgi:nucleoid-associated protein YgaU
MTLPVLFDAWLPDDDVFDPTQEAQRLLDAGHSIESQLADLESLAFPSGSDSAPPQIKIQAAGGAVPHQGRDWVIDSLTWGDALMNDNGDRVRQEVTLALLEYIPEERITALPASPANREREAANAKNTKPGAGPKRTTVTAPTRGRGIGAVLRGSQLAQGPGEDLLSIAARELGDAERWREIADLNGIRDPRSITLGQVVRLP